MRDVEPVLAAEAEEEVVARDAGDLLRLEAEELADAVVLVDDEVAGAQVGEGCERPAEAVVGARRPLAEDLRVREQDEPELAPDEAAPRRRDGEAERRRRSAARRRRSSRPASTRAEQVLLTQRLASVRRTRRRPADRRGRRRRARSPPRSARGRRSPAAAPRRRRAGRAGTDRARRAPARSTGSSPSSSQTRAHLVRLPDEVGRAVEGRDEVARASGDRPPLIVGQGRLREVGRRSAAG